MTPLPFLIGGVVAVLMTALLVTVLILFGEVAAIAASGLVLVLVAVFIVLTPPRGIR